MLLTLLIITFSFLGMIFSLFVFEYSALYWKIAMNFDERLDYAVLVLNTYIFGFIPYLISLFV